MNLKIGTTIKSLRTKNKVTQDQLATFLGCTPQAISRWESETSYPDIELLPSIAEFFSVSTDELLGLNRTEKEKRLAEIYNVIAMHDELGSKETAIPEARKFTAEFPSDERIQAHLANTLCRVYMWDGEAESHLAELTEAEKIYLALIDRTEDQEFKNSMITRLASLYYNGFHDTLRAERIMATLPSMRNCREVTRSAILSGNGGDQKPKQEYMEQLADRLCACLTDYIACVIPNDPEGWDQKIAYYRQVIDLYHMIFGENLTHYHGDVAKVYRFMATYLIAQGKTEETLDALEKMCDHAVAAEAAKPGDPFTSPFTNCLVYGEEWSNKHINTAYFCYYKMKHQSRYDAIREEPRFQAIMERLREVAKCITPVKDWKKQ